jgi:ribulose-5-phosphate 4-epimerase/fuculose-1-phosphate aldolase
LSISPCIYIQFTSIFATRAFTFNLLRNHGPVTIGFSLANAFGLMWLLTRACEVQQSAQAMGRLRPIAQPVLEACVRDSLNFDPRFGAGQDAFDAMVRLVERRDPSFRR